MKKEISLRHLLTMSAGFKWNDWGPSMRKWLYFSPDWVKSAIQLPQENNPGEVFNYNSSTSHLLSAILSKSTGTSTLDFAKQYLFVPLGIQPAYWHVDQQGYNIGGFGLGLSARDLAKFGFLYLNNGYWNGQSIVSEFWVKESTRQQIQAVSHPSESGKLSQVFDPETDLAEIVLNNRSVMEVLSLASLYVQVPEADLVQENVSSNRERPVADWVEIRTSLSEPSDAWLKVKHRDSWFYIASNDAKSRTSFMLLEAIFSSVVGNIPGAKPLLTLPVK